MQVTDLLIANQLVGPRRMERLVALRRIADPITVVDSPALVDAVSAAAVDGGVVIRTMVEVDIGMQRAGVPPGEPTVELARRIAEAPGLELIGIMGYEGHLLLEQDLEKKESAIAASVAELKATRDAVVAAGLPCPIVSAGGTGSYPFTAKQPGLTEIQAGGGVFMDLLYRRQCQILYVPFQVPRARPLSSHDFLSPTRGVPPAHRVVTPSRPTMQRSGVCADHPHNRGEPTDRGPRHHGRRAQDDEHGVQHAGTGGPSRH